MCKIFDWVFDSVSVEQAPQNHFEDPNQDEDEDPMFLNEGLRLELVPARVHNITSLFHSSLLSMRRNDMVSF